MEITQDQLLREVYQATLESESIYYGHILALCQEAVLNVWDGTEEIGKNSESFTKDIQGPK